MRKNVFFLVALPFICVSCFNSPPPAPNTGRILAPDGKWVEQRIVRHYSRRPKEIYHVYRDSLGNFVRHGTDSHFFLTGQVKFREFYREGLLDSVTEFWYANGNKQGELPYRRGKPHGKAITWYPDGKKQSERDWEEGRLLGPIREWDGKGIPKNP